MYRFGCHLSIRKGYAEAAKTAKAMGLGAFQYFPKNPRSLSVKACNEADARLCAAVCREYGIDSVAHAPYPTNLAASAKADLVSRSLLNDLHIAELCGSIGVVVHFGVHAGPNPLEGYRNILQLLNSVLTRFQGKAMLLIENQAGERSPMGTTLEEMMKIRSLCVKPEQVGFCFDTCHAFASGLWRPGQWKSWLDSAYNLGYIEHVKAIHLNDSKYPFRSGKDRHANIGQGHIGDGAFRELLQSEFVRNIPLILETPSDGHVSHSDEIRRLEHLAQARD